MAYFDISTATSFGVPQANGTMKGYSFNDGQGAGLIQPSLTSSSPALPGATIGTNSWWPGLTAQTPGGTPNPVAAASGLNWPSPGAVGIAPGTQLGGAAGSTISDYLIRGAVFLLGLVFVGGGVAMFGRK